MASRPMTGRKGRTGPNGQIDVRPRTKNDLKLAGLSKKSSGAMKIIEASVAPHFAGERESSSSFPVLRANEARLDS